MASVTLVRTISFSIYQKAKYSYSAAIGRVTGEEPLVTVNRPGSIPTPGTLVCFGAAGATAGAIAAFIACPFELTKQAAQISVLMASSNNKTSVDDPVRSSYQQKGAFGTARNVIMHRGVRGLYSGFGFHIREFHRPLERARSADADSKTHSPRHRWHSNLLYDVRKCQTASCQVPGQ